jgi:hypothetical protein
VFSRALCCAAASFSSRWCIRFKEKNGDEVLQTARASWFT